MTEDRIDGPIKEGFGHVQDAVGGLTGDARTQASGKVNEAAGAIQNAYGQVKDQAQAVIGEATDQVRDAVDALAVRLRDKPLLGAGLALGVGLAVGALLLGGRKVVYVRR